MIDFAQQTTVNYVRFYPISAAAKKYVENRQGFYEKYYRAKESCTVFEIPDDETDAEYYGKRLAEAGFHVQKVEAQ